MFRAVGPTVNVPDQILAGTTVGLTAEFEDAASFTWTDWDGNEQVTDRFDVTAVAPGSLTLSVRATDTSGQVSPSTEQTIVIEESPDGPRIVGPSTLAVGQQQEYTIDAPGRCKQPRLDRRQRHP